MNDELPKLIRINHDDYAARRIGQIADGRQFFLTNPFVPADRNGDGGSEFIALYIFDADGRLLNAKIDNLGVRKNVDEENARSIIQARLNKLGEFSFDDIIIAPFSINKFDIEFGLILHMPEEDDEVLRVTVEPGDYMCFFPPWDGDYDT